MPLEGHGKEAVQILYAADRKHLRLPRVVVAEPQAEEIPDRSFHTRCLLAVPVDAQHDPYEMVGFRAVDGKPQVRDQAGTVGIEQREGYPGVNLTIISIGPCGIRA